MNTRRVIRVDGTEVPLDKPVSIADIKKLINATSLDTVSLLQFGRYPLWVMCVDDMGYDTSLVDHGNGILEQVPIRARKPVNARATELYLQRCVPGTTHQIVGDVVVTMDEDFA